MINIPQIMHATLLRTYIWDDVLQDFLVSSYNKKEYEIKLCKPELGL